MHLVSRSRNSRPFSVSRTWIERRSCSERCCVKIAVLDHLLDVVGDVRAEIAAAQRQLADGHLGIADIEQHHSLDIVDVVDAEPFELQLHDLEKMPVKALDERNHLEISVVHAQPRLRNTSRAMLDRISLNLLFFKFYGSGLRIRNCMIPEKSSGPPPSSTKAGKDWRRPRRAASPPRSRPPPVAPAADPSASSRR